MDTNGAVSAKLQVNRRSIGEIAWRGIAPPFFRIYWEYAPLWGDKPEYFRQMSIGMAKEGFKGIDINMGCLVANVAENGKGSGLICRPGIAADIIQAAKAGGLLKTRLGFSSVDEWRDWLTHILKQDIVICPFICGQERK